MIIVQITEEQFRGILREEVRNSLQEHYIHKPDQFIDEVLDINEVMTLTKLRKPTIYKLTSTGKIPFFKRSKNLYFMKSEIIEWLLERRKNLREKFNHKCSP